MLILQTDYVTIHLLKNYGKFYSPDGDGDLFGLCFHVQVNGKLKTHTTAFAIKETTPPNCAPKTFEVDDRTSINTSIEMLASLGYEIDVSMALDKIIKTINDN